MRPGVSSTFAGDVKQSAKIVRDVCNRKALQVYRVKIDGSFVRDIRSDRNSKATVKGIVELAKGLGIETVAEYVENDEIAKEVRRLGVDYAQGYAFGKPTPLAAILDGLAKDESKRLHRLYLET